MKRYRRGLAFVFSVLLVGWILYERPQPAKLLRVFPSRTVMISAHDAVLERLPAAIENPLVQGILASMDTTPEELRLILDDPQLSGLLKFLLSDQLFCGYVPQVGSYGSGAWILLDSLGSKTVLARILIQWLDIPGVSVVEQYEGYTIYAVSDEKRREMARFAIVECGIIMAISRDAYTIKNALNGYLGLTRPLISEDAAMQLTGRDGVDAPDRIWLAAGMCFPSTPTLWGLSGVTAERLQGVALTPLYLKVNLDKEPSPAWIPRLMSAAPHAYAVIPPDVLFDMLDYYLGQGTMAVLRPLVNYLSGWVSLALYGEEHSGRYLRMKLPVLVAGASIKNRSAVLDRIQRYIDSLNACYQWGLIMSRSGHVAGMDLYAISGITENQYGGRPSEELLGLALSGDALLISSNLESLRKILSESEKTPGEPVPPALTDRMNGASVGGLWFDLQRGGKALRLALTGYSLALLMEDPSATLAKRQQVNEIKAWIDALAPLEKLVAGIYADGRVLRIDFTASE